MQMRDELRKLFNAGRYLPVVDVCDELLAKLQGSHYADGSGSALRLLLNERARALRNLGRIQEALRDYVQALESAHENGSPQEVAWQLVLFGKIFGKYLERHTLFYACLREAEHRYIRLMEEAGPGASESLIIQFAIVQDLLGSHYRHRGERDFDARSRSEEAYTRSLEYHRRAKNLEGVGRATCHLAYTRAIFAGMNSSLSGQEQLQVWREALLLFESGIKIVIRLPHAGRGRATRKAQQAHIYLMLGNWEYARTLAEDAIIAAQKNNDPRAVVFAQRILAFSLTRAGMSVEAIRELEEACVLAGEMKFSGFERRILAELAELYLGGGDWQKAIESLEENDRLAEKELLEFDSGFGGALDVFRAVAPERADRYIREGQRQDYENLISELINNGRLRQLISRFEESLSSKRQEAILSFVKKAWRHTVRNDLNAVAAIILRLRNEPNLARGFAKKKFVGLLDEAEAILEKTSNQLGPESPESTFGRASMLTELGKVAHQMFDPVRVRIEATHDVVFPDLAPEALRYAFRHLLENARAAIDGSPPAALDTPLIVISQEVKRQGGIMIMIMNAGANPTEPLRADRGGVIHGFSNASWFFREVLGFDCWFELREDGPRTLPMLSNCVAISIPPSGTTLSLYRIEPFTEVASRQ